MYFLIHGAATWVHWVDEDWARMEPRLPHGLRSAPYDFILGPRLRQWLSGQCSSHRQANHTSHFKWILHWTKSATWPSAIPMGQKLFFAHSGRPYKSQLQGSEKSRKITQSTTPSLGFSFPFVKEGSRTSSVCQGQFQFCRFIILTEVRLWLSLPTSGPQHGASYLEGK